MSGWSLKNLPGFLSFSSISKFNFTLAIGSSILVQTISSLIANKKDIDNFARGNKNVRFLKGWRFNIFGKLVQ